MRQFKAVYRMEAKQANERCAYCGHTAQHHSLSFDRRCKHSSRCVCAEFKVRCGYSTALPVPGRCVRPMGHG